MDGRSVDGGRRHDVDVTATAASAVARLPALPRTIDGPVQLRIRGLFGARTHGGARGGGQVRVEHPVVSAGPVHAVAVRRGAAVRRRRAVRGRPDRYRPAREFRVFSGVFREFTVSVAKTYVAADAEGWTVVGTYVGKNVRGVQVRVHRRNLFLFCLLGFLFIILFPPPP